MMVKFESLHQIITKIESFSLRKKFIFLDVLKVSYRKHYFAKNTHFFSSKNSSLISLISLSGSVCVCIAQYYNLFREKTQLDFCEKAKINISFEA